jgi:hypothetical protein
MHIIRDKNIRLGLKRYKQALDKQGELAEIIEALLQQPVDAP